MFNLFLCPGQVDQSFQMQRFVMQRYAWGHLQSHAFRKPHMLVESPTVFFWAPHLAQHFDLGELRKAALVRAGCAETLTARVRALYVRLVICFRGTPGKMVHRLVEELRHKKVENLPSRNDVWVGVRRKLLGRELPNIYPNSRLLQQVFERFASRRSVVADSNQRKILELLRNAEAGRAFCLEKLSVSRLPGWRCAVLQARFKEVANLY